MVRPAVLVLAGAVTLAALVIALLWAFQRSLVHLPDPGPVPPAAQVLPGAQDVLLETEDGLELGAWARRFLLQEAGVPEDRLLYFGESLGAAVVTELATEHPPAGLVLRSPFEDLASVGRVHYPLLPVRALLRDRYPVLQSIASVDAPTTVVLGTADTVVPPEQSRRVAAAALRLHRLVAIPGADHDDHVLAAGDQVVSAVVELADRTRAP